MKENCIHFQKDLVQQEVDHAEKLSTSGIRTDIAENGHSVLEKFSNSPDGYFDAILMDIKMPGMDGLEANHYRQVWMPIYQSLWNQRCFIKRWNNWF